MNLVAEFGRYGAGAKIVQRALKGELEFAEGYSFQSVSRDHWPMHAGVVPAVFGLPQSGSIAFSTVGAAMGAQFQETFSHKLPRM